MPDTVISVGGDIRDLQSKLAKAEKEVDDLKGRLDRKSKSGGSNLLGGLTGAVGGLIGVSAIKGVIDDFDRIGDLAARLDVTAESIQRVGRQAKLSGTDVEAAVSALTKIRKNIEGGGDDKTSKALAEIGINAEQLLKLEPDQQIILLADAFQHAQSKGTGFVALQDLMGKGFVELLPLLQTSREELQKMSEQPVVSEATIQRLQDFNDRLDGAVMTGKVGLIDGLDKIVTELYLSGVALTDGVKAANDLEKGLAEEGKKDLETRKKRQELQRKAAADAAAEKAANDKAEAGAKQQLANEKAKADIAFDSLTTAEKLEEVYARIADVNQRAEGLRGKNEPLVAAQLEGELVALMKQQAGLKKQAADEAEREADAAQRTADQAKREGADKQKKLQGQMESQRSLSEELAILQAQASGRDKLAEKMQKEAKVRADAKKIADETGLPPAEARAAAEEKQRLEDRIEGRKKGKIYGAKASASFTGLADLYRDNQTPLSSTFTFGGLNEKARKDKRDAAGNLMLPIGKGFATAAQQKADEKKEQAREGPALLEAVLKRIAENTEALRDLD